MKTILIGPFRLRNFLENQFWRKNENGFSRHPFRFPTNWLFWQAEN